MSMPSPWRTHGAPGGTNMLENQSVSSELERQNRTALPCSLIPSMPRPARPKESVNRQRRLPGNEGRARLSPDPGNRALTSTKGRPPLQRPLLCACWGNRAMALTAPLNAESEFRRPGAAPTCATLGHTVVRTAVAFRAAMYVLKQAPGVLRKSPAEPAYRWFHPGRPHAPAITPWRVFCGPAFSA